MSNTDKPNVRIYILCYNEERLRLAKEKYASYYWAIPILMKYQDDTCENAFWKQLLEIKHEWQNCEMVGTLSYTAFSKIDLNITNTIICSRDKWVYGYHYFFQPNRPIEFRAHPPAFKTIITDVCNILHRKVPMEHFCNYMMCTPQLMTKFIRWVTTCLIPIVRSHPLIMTDANYTDNTLNSRLSTEKCMALFKVSYYPMLPFVIERLTCLFFSKKVILVSHDNSNSGAPIILKNLYNYLQINNYTVTLCYLNSNIWNYIYTTSLYNDVTVVCNTLVCDEIVNNCNINNIPVIWYIHEWLDNEYLKYWNFLIRDKTFLSKANKLVFPCNKAYMNHLAHSNNTISDKSITIPHGYNFDIFETKKNSPIKFIRENNSIYICMIGAIVSRKNQHSFINNVFIPLLNKVPNIYLLLVGKIYETVISHPKIIVIGEVDNPIPYINISDILVSYSHNEVLPMNIIEACLCKKAIIASNVGGTCEIIKDSYSGFLVEVNDHITTTNKLLEYIDNPELRITYGENAYKDAIQNYNQDNNFLTFAKCIDSFTNHLI
jgi:glycosyltransferase involved in cell wall biosynthesis